MIDIDTCTSDNLLAVGDIANGDFVVIHIGDKGRIAANSEPTITSTTISR